ncbi:acyl-CoA synthetase FdrA, partial [Escherichia coli]
TWFWTVDFNYAPPRDIFVGLLSEAEDEGSALAIMQLLEEAIKQLAQGSGSSQALKLMRCWDSACQKLPDANLALLSVDGEAAAELENKTLGRTLNVMMVYDHVELGDEIQLKNRAEGKCLLLLGTDRGIVMVTG